MRLIQELSELTKILRNINKYQQLILLILKPQILYSKVIKFMNEYIKIISLVLDIY